MPKSDLIMETKGGKEYVLWKGLLNEAHRQGVECIDTELVQIPSDDNRQVAISKATVWMPPVGDAEDSRKFTGIGDASPENVGRNIVPHIIRMSETRAKARAVRDAINVGVMSAEELGGEA